MTDVSQLPPSEFDILGALELHLWIAEVDVTKRCMTHAFTVFQDKIVREGFEEETRLQVEEFLDEMLSILVGGLAKGRKKSASRMQRNDLISEVDLQKFYCGSLTPWTLSCTVRERLLHLSNELSSTSSSSGDKKAAVPQSHPADDKFNRICWKYYLQEKKSVVTNKDWLSPECTYRLFLLYNKLLLQDGTTDLEVGQVNAFLMKLVHISEYTWSPQLEYKAEGCEYVNFPELISVITDYFTNLSLDTDFTCELILELYELMNLGILKKGELTKKGHVNKLSWKKRYFVLQLTRLKYYTDKALQDMKGEMVLNRNSKIINIRNAHAEKPCLFRVTCGESGKEFDIFASSQRSKQSWILAIQKALSLTKIRAPSDRQDFIQSVTQWRKSVYGSVSDSPFEMMVTEGSRPPSSTFTMRAEMTDLVAQDLKSNRSVVKSGHFGQSVSSVSSDFVPGSFPSVFEEGLIPSSPPILESTPEEYNPHYRFPPSNELQDKDNKDTAKSTDQGLYVEMEPLKGLPEEDYELMVLPVDTTANKSPSPSRDSSSPVDSSATCQSGEEQHQPPIESPPPLPKSEKRHSYINLSDLDDLNLQVSNELQPQQQQQQNGLQSDLQAQANEESCGSVKNCDTEEDYEVMYDVVQKQRSSRTVLNNENGYSTGGSHDLYEDASPDNPILQD